MANAKISDAAFISTTDVTTIDGFAAYSGANNSKISGNALVSSLETNLNLNNFTTGILPIARGGTGSGTAGIANVGGIIDEGSQVIGTQLVFSDDGAGNTVLNAIKNSFSFMATVNQALPNIGYSAGAWNNVGWEYAPTGSFLKYTQTAANPKIRKSHFKEQEANCELEMTISLSGVSTGTYDWELRLVDPLGTATTQVITSSALVGATPSMNDFDAGGGTWGAGWQQVRVTGVNLTYFSHVSNPTEGELELYINGNSGWANVGCSCRFMSN